MKKFVTLFLALALVLAMGAVSLAADPYPQTTKDWKVNVTINAEGGIDVTYTVSSDDLVKVDWVEMAIYDHEIDITGKDMTDEGMPHKMAIGRANNNTYISERTINKGEAGADSYPFEEGKTYYIWLMACGSDANDGVQGDWVWNTVPTEFTYSTTGDTTPEQPGTDDPDNGGDFSAIAYAAAALAGCGALVIRKKK